MSEALHLFMAGGLVMYPLAFCSIVVVAIAIERFIYYRKAQSDMEKLMTEMPLLLGKNDIHGLKELLEADGGFPAMTIDTAVDHLGSSANQNAIVEGAASHGAALLRNYLNYLDVIVTMSPLLGLLGTVTGMISSFSVLSISEGQPFAITAGVGEALIATATGLLVAILALIAHTYLSHRLDGLVSDMERISSVYLAHVDNVRAGVSHEA